MKKDFGMDEFPGQHPSRRDLLAVAAYAISSAAFAFQGFNLLQHIAEDDATDYPLRRPVPEKKSGFAHLDDYIADRMLFLSKQIEAMVAHEKAGRQAIKIGNATMVVQKQESGMFHAESEAEAVVIYAPDTDSKDVQALSVLHRPFVPQHNLVGGGKDEQPYQEGATFIRQPSGAWTLDYFQIRPKVAAAKYETDKTDTQLAPFAYSLDESGVTTTLLSIGAILNAMK